MSISTSCRYANCDSFGPLHLQTNIKVIVRLICLYVFFFFLVLAEISGMTFSRVKGNLALA